MQVYSQVNTVIEHLPSFNKRIVCTMLPRYLFNLVNVQYLIVASSNTDIDILPGLTLLLASWLSWQELAKFLLHLGNHGSHGKILIKILLK